MGRVDHKLNSRNTLSGRFNFDNFIDTNPQDNVGVNTLPSAARTFRRRGYLIQAAENTLFKPTLVNDLRFELLFGSPITRFDPATPSIQLVRSGVLASTGGESRIANLTNHEVQFADTLSWTKGKHYVRFGGDAVRSSSGGIGQEFGSGFLWGQFRFAPDAGCTGESGVRPNIVVDDRQSFHVYAEFRHPYLSCQRMALVLVWSG